MKDDMWTTDKPVTCIVYERSIQFMKINFTFKIEEKLICFSDIVFQICFFAITLYLGIQCFSTLTPL
jgi:hypothetical protein